MNCFKCSSNFNATNELLKHLRGDHFLKDNDILHCKQNNCFRMFNSFNSFRKHLNQHAGQILSKPPCVDKSSDSFNNSYNKNSHSLVSDKNTTHDQTTLLQNIDNFKSDFMNLVIEMYSNPLVPRKFVQSVIIKYENIICNFLKPCEEFVMSRLKELYDSDENIKIVEKLFHCFQNVFGDFNTEYKCIESLKNSEIFVSSQNVSIGQTLQKIYKNNTVVLTPTTLQFKMLSLVNLFTKLLNTNHLLNDMTEYMEKMLRDNTIVSNFVQCELWQSKVTAFENKRVFPLFLFYDDYEIGNPLGSRAGNNKLGAVYITVPCLPPHLTCKLEYIFLFALFYSKHRKEFGNCIFQELINELKYLENIGIKLNDNTIVYFKVGLICGDNLGIHSILGFTESFSANYSCRFCKAGKSLMKVMTVQDDSLLRNAENYRSDVVTNNLSMTGIKEESIWHQLSDFHVTSNFFVDIMHDIFEGVCIYDLSALLNTLIFHFKFFSIEILNARITCFNYTNIEMSNKPPLITADKVKSLLHMSASEMLCFSRYFGLIIGNLVPENLGIWELWITLREIIDIVTAPYVHSLDYHRLKVLIEEHNAIYLKYCSHLKPKHHLLVHYPLILKNSGPLHHLWCMRTEQKHRQSKFTANVSCSYKNPLKTLMFKSQLQLSLALKEINTAKDNSYGRLKPLDTDICEMYFKNFDKNLLFVTKWVSHLGTTYEPNYVIIVEWTSELPVFAIIKYIIIHQNQIHFLCRIIKTESFSRHLYSFIVTLSKDEDNNFLEILKLEELHSYIPCVLTNLNGRSYITIRHSV